MSAASAQQMREPVGRYRDRDGVEHKVLVHDSGGAWVIADEAASGQARVVVDRLCGEGESRLTAEAVARDWIAQQQKPR